MLSIKYLSKTFYVISTIRYNLTFQLSAKFYEIDPMTKNHN